jgi:hypothetical protein
MRQRAVARPEAMTEGGLSRLLETEARIAASLAAAEAEAAKILEAAKAATEADARDMEERLEGEMASLAARVTAERDAEITRVAAGADEGSRRLQELPDNVVEELAGWVTEQLLADARPGSGP